MTPCDTGGVEDDSLARTREISLSKGGFMSFLRAFFAVTLFYINASHALDLQDSATWNPQLDAVLKTMDFEQSFTCGSSAMFRELVNSCEVTCDSTACWSMCMSPADPLAPAPRTVVNCTPDSFGVLAQGTGGYFEVQKAEFAQTQGRPLLFVLNRIQDFIHCPSGATFKITSLADKPYIIRRGTPTEVTLPAMQVEGTIHYPGIPHTISATLSILKDGPGVARLARLRLQNETWFLLDNVQ